MIRHTSIFVTAVLLASWFVGSHAAYADNFGAIAYSPSSGAFGRSWDYPNRRAAERKAMRGCRKHARDCRVFWFRNACGAVAWGNNKGWGSAWGSTSRRAQRLAINKCSQFASGCKTRVWQCTTR